MSIYFIVIFISTIGALLAQKSENNSATQKVFIFFVFAALVLFAGLRSGQVGTDTGNYIRIFNSEKFLNRRLLENLNKEIGFIILMRTARAISTEYWSLLTAIGAISVYYHIKAIKMLSSNFAISIFIFLALGTYTFLFNGARQALKYITTITI